jgi:Tfp pilus assembly protein PilX
MNLFQWRINNRRRRSEEMKSSIRNQKGIALITTMMLLVLAIGVVAILFRLSTRETKLAVLEQGYTVALDAAKAGADDFMVYVQNCINTVVQNGGSVTTCNNPSPPNNPPPGFGPTTFGTSRANGACLTVKLLNPTVSSPTINWSTYSNWTNNACGTLADAQSTTLPLTNPDLTITLNTGNTPYTVNVKVIDTAFSTATGNNQQYYCQKGCFYYTVIAQAQAAGSNQYAEVYFVYRFDGP